MDLKNNYSRYFPTSYEHRPQQIKITNDVIKGMKNNKLILVESPPGTGKTLAILNGVLSLVRFPKGRIFWLGAYQNIHRNLTKDILTINREKSSDLMLSLFIRKQDMCFGDYEKSPSGFYDWCKNLRENKKCPFFNNTFIISKVSNKDGGITKTIKLTEEALQLRGSLRKKFRTGQYNPKDQMWANIVMDECEENYCAYEIMKLLITSSDIFAGDYNYVFLRGIRINMGRSGELFNLNRQVLVIDEADKFHDRLLEQLTFKLSSKMVKRVKNRLEEEIKELKKDDPFIHLPTFKDHLEFIKNFDKIMKIFITKHLQLKPKKQVKIDKQFFIRFLNDQGGFNFYYERITEIIRDAYSEEKWSSRMDDFFEMWIELDESNFVRVAKKESPKNIPGKDIQYSINIHPLNIHNVPLYFKRSTPFYLSDVLRDFHDIIFLSATLYPDIFTKQMGLDRWPQVVSKVTDYHIPPENYLLAVTNSFLNSEYNQRSEMASNYAELMYQLLRRHPIEKALVFGVKKEMTFNIREHFESIKPKIDPTRVKWSWIRSSESRGIDLSGYSICLIAGLPYPPTKTNILVKARLENLKKEFGKQDGWRIFNSDIVKESIQSFCRILRQPDDRALIILGDPRFAQGEYYQHFPWYYQERMTMCNSFEDLLHLSKNFFNEKKITIEPLTPTSRLDRPTPKLPPEMVEYHRRVIEDAKIHQQSGKKGPFRPTYTVNSIKRELQKKEVD